MSGHSEQGILREDIEHAAGVAFADSLKWDCVLIGFESDAGSFTVEFGAFDDGPVYNVAGFGSNITAADFVPELNLVVVDQGQDYVVYQGSTIPSKVIEDIMAISSTQGATATSMKLKNVENMPSWWPEVLTP